MRVLLTGGTGQVGTEVRKRLTNVELLVPGRDALDLSRPEQVSGALAKLMPDVVLSVGAYTAVDRAEDEAEQAMVVNGLAVSALADYCREHDKPLFHVSTDYVFDGSKAGPYRVDDATCPLGVYGATKLAGEEAARTVKKHLVLRVSWVFSGHGSNFVKTMLRLASTNKALRVVGDQVGGPTWAGHIADALVALVQRHRAGESLPWGTYHFSGGPDVSWYDFAGEIFRQAQSVGNIGVSPTLEPISTADYPTKAARPKNSCLSMEETTRSLGLDRQDWRTGLRETLLELKGI